MACKNETKQAEEVNEQPVFSSASFQKASGADFSVSYPKLTTGSKALKDSIQSWVENTVRNYSISGEEAPTTHMTLEQSATEFIAMYQRDESDIPYSFDIKDTILAATPEFVSVRMDIYLSTGGAHPNYFSELAVFDSKTGAKIPKSLYIKDEAAILPMLEIAYKAEKQEAFDEGFSFDSGQISFPAQTAITENGVLFHYNTYEIAAYVLGDADIFLTWTDLGNAAVSPWKK